MFGRSKKIREKAISFISENLDAQLSVFLRSGVLIDSVQDDSYIAGYLQGKITSLIAYFIKVEGMSPADANAASGMVLMNVFGKNDAITVSHAIKSHSSQRSVSYQNGLEKGALIAQYAVRAKKILEDDDYALALDKYRDAERSFGTAQKLDEHWAAVSGLEMLWFSDRLISRSA